MNDAILSLLGGVIGTLMNKGILDLEEVRNLYFSFGEDIGLTREEAVEAFGEIIQELNDGR